MLLRICRQFRMSRKRPISTVATTVLGISLMLFLEDAFRSAVPIRTIRSNGSSDGSDDAVLFRQLQTLLQTVPVEPRCRHQHQLGGTCFLCQTGDDSVMGQLDGSKPICLDWMPSSNCSVLSFGINNDFSFDDQMADLGCTVHAFDPTMDGPAAYRRSERVFFHRVGIAAADGELGGFAVVSLRTAARRAGADLLQDGGIDYLKLDVEGSEWDVLLDGDGVRQLQNGVTQLAVEFHLIHGDRPSLASGVGLQVVMVDPRVSPAAARRAVTAITRLQEAGFVLTHTIHSIACQRYAGVGCLPFLYETVWANTARIADH